MLASLHVGVTLYEFRIWEAVAGCAMRVTHSGAATAPSDPANSGVAAEEPTGIEVDNPELAITHDTRDVLESFTLPAGHFRLLHPQFYDQTDFANELVQELTWLLHPCTGHLRLQGNLFNIESTVTGHGLLLWKHAA